MTRLERTLIHQSGEIPHGFAGRLARSINVPINQFCTEVGISMAALADGQPESLDRLATISGADRSELGRASIAKVLGGWRINGQALDHSALSRTRLRVCPHCLTACGTQLPPARRAGLVKATWIVTPIRTCPTHEVALVEVMPHKDGRMNPLDIHDMPSRTASIVQDPQRHCAATTHRPPNGLETYLLARISEGSHGDTWLDGLPFHVAARFCEMLGALAVHGRDHTLKVIEERGWHEAGAQGFAIAAEGVASIRSFLDEVRRRSASAMHGAQAAYGRLYKWLASGETSADFDPVKRLVHDHVVETMPVEKGDVVLGIEVAERRVHSVRTAGLETGLHPKRLRRLLANAGHLPVGHEALPNNLVLFDAREAATLLQAARDQVSLSEAQTYLNAPRVQAKLLSESGLISPIASTKGLRTSMYAFARRDLDDFLRRLLSRAVDVEAVEGGRANIPAAAKRANCGAAEVVRLVLAGRLAWVGRHAGTSGYMSIIVDVAEVKELTRGQPVEGLGLVQVQRRLQCSDAVAAALVRSRILPSRLARNPVNRCPMPVVSEFDIASFEKSYVSLFRLAKQVGLHFRVVQSRLASAGVRSAFDPKRCRGTFYPRAQAGRVFE